jgi:hypothetical protein
MTELEEVYGFADANYRESLRLLGDSILLVQDFVDLYQRMFDRGRERISRRQMPHGVLKTGNEGVDLRAIKELGCWRILNRVMRYAHLAPDHLCIRARREPELAPLTWAY